MVDWTTHTAPLGVIGKSSPGEALPVTLYGWEDFDYGSTSYLTRTWTSATTGSGIGKIYADRIKGYDTFSDREFVILEGTPECTIERWSISLNPPTFSGFSAGGQGDADNLLNNPLDVTVDADDNVYVLDILSTGEPRIKMFDSELNPVMGIGDSTIIPGTPIRVDWDDYNDKIHILTTGKVVVLDVKQS